MNSFTKSDSKIYAMLSSIVISASIFLLVGSAFAATPEVQTEVVKFPDLDIQSPAGIGKLYGRIHAAAERVCGVNIDRDLGVSQQAKVCTAQAEARAVQAVNNAAFTAYYESKSGQRVQTLIAMTR
jgi:UrcA family protein